jgi:hypothetical protein
MAIQRWCFAVLCIVSGLRAHAGDLAVRDALTGVPLLARVQPLDVAAAAFAADGRLRAFPAAAMRGRVRIEAAAHRSVDIAIGARDMPTTVLLDPIEEPEAYVRLAQRAARDPRARWLQGYVRDTLDGHALAGVLLSIEGRSTRSDEVGYFEIELDAIDAEAAATDTSTLEAHAAGYADLQRSGIARTAGVQRLLLAVGGNSAARSMLELGARDRAGGVGDGTVDTAAPLPRTAMPGTTTSLAPALLPPETVAVGYADAACTQSCCSGSCSHTCVLPLETYVRRGLDSEWIASWNTQSLRAGSIAYRSYGAWRVAHPINANFDICSSACCQVNDAGTSSSTDNAIARTPGLMLTRSGSEAASAVYSAENNSWDDPGDGLACSNSDLSCGDGSAGSPATGWPCLADAVGAGHGCFGHGRGMSQWGTQRWAIDASARRWPWIVDHYFNDNGNASGAGTGQRTAQMTSPLGVSGASAQPASIAPGAAVHIDANATNNAGASHAHLLVGASLYRSGVGYVDDSAHDAPLDLATGSHAIARDFHTPATLAPGSYDLLVSLYLDVDENGAITAADLPLALTTTAHALLVVDDRIFINGFDGAP